MLDNQNTKLSDAYYIDKGTISVIGKKGTPVKYRIPEPQLDEEVDYEKKNKDPIIRGKEAGEKRVRDMKFWYPRAKKVQ